VRGPKRELVSRAYNRLLGTTLRARFSDAQCGFKAGRAVVLRGLLPDVRDERWFFDTELLVQAQRRGLRIHEVPVDWVDDKDSRVDIVATAWENLRGIARLAGQTQVARFVAVGIASTIAYAVLYLLLRGGLGPGSANALALAFTAIANTQANRRLTFGWLIPRPAPPADRVSRRRIATCRRRPCRWHCPPSARAGWVGPVRDTRPSDGTGRGTNHLALAPRVGPLDDLRRVRVLADDDVAVAVGDDVLDIGRLVPRQDDEEL
jgi:hypothetical protein